MAHIFEIIWITASDGSASHFFLGFGSARIFTSARRPDEFQVPIFFRSFSSFLPWLVKRQKEPWAFSLSSCCLVHCIPWSLTTPRWMGRCCTPKIPRPSWAKSSPCSSWTSWRGRRKAWRVWRLAGRFQKVLPSSSSLVCGMPLATSWRCCPWVPWRVASISSCCSRNFWSLLSWWCTLRAQCKVPWFRLCLKHFLAPTAVHWKTPRVIGLLLQLFAISRCWLLVSSGVVCVLPPRVSRTNYIYKLLISWNVSSNPSQLNHAHRTQWLTAWNPSLNHI